MGLRAAANRRPKWTAAGCKERGRPKSSAQIRKKVVPFCLFFIINRFQKKKKRGTRERIWKM